MYAIVQTGGKQYKIAPTDQLKVEKLPGEPGTQVDLGNVLALSTPGGIKVGTPLIEDAVVKATILKTAKDRKVVVFKKKRRKGYSKKQGHRQWYTLLRIDEIVGPGTAEAAPESPAGETEA
ncbi:MAG: 50S ribosomal protein L21 [Thermodesulfobacteriota bacterium]